MVRGWVLLHAQLAVLQGHVASVLHGASRSLPAAAWHVVEAAETVLRFVLAKTLAAQALLFVFSSASPLVLVLVGLVGQLRETIGATPIHDFLGRAAEVASSLNFVLGGAAPRSSKLKRPR